MLVLTCLLVSSLVVSRTQAQGSGEATIFAEGVISTAEYESHSQFTPDGKQLYFVKSTPNFSFWTIARSRFENGKWTAPEVAPFSGQYSDADPFITADGSRLFFISNRPAPGKTNRDLDIWVMEKTSTGWSEPRNPGPPVNSPGNEWFPTATEFAPKVSPDGKTFFFTSTRGFADEPLTQRRSYQRN